MQGLRERGKLERRQRILDAAAELLVRGGVDALSMRSLSERAGLSVPTIYNLIGSREEVLLAVLAGAGPEFDLLMVPAPQACLDRCEHIARSWAELLAGRQVIVRSVLQSGHAINTLRGNDVLIGRVVAALAEAFGAGREQGVLRGSVDPERLAASTAAMGSPSIVAWAIDDGDAERLRAGLRHAVLYGLLVDVTEDHRLRVVRRARVVERQLGAFADVDSGDAGTRGSP